jgi:hypothetical protein
MQQVEAKIDVSSFNLPLIQSIHGQATLDDTVRYTVEYRARGRSSNVAALERAFFGGPD